MPKPRIMISVLTGVTVLGLVGGCSDDSASRRLTGRLPDQVEAGPSSTTRAPSSPSVSNEAAPDPESPVVDGGASDVEDVELAFSELMATRVDCGRDPWSCELDRLAVTGSATHARLDELFSVRRSSRIVASDRGGLRFLVEGVEFDGTDRADVEVCLTDDTVLVDERGWVFDDGLYSARVVFELTRTELGWRWSDDRTVEETRGEDLCGSLG